MEVNAHNENIDTKGGNIFMTLLQLLCPFIVN